jgi:hypothetical protein
MSDKPQHPMRTAPQGSTGRTIKPNLEVSSLIVLRPNTFYRISMTMPRQAQRIQAFAPNSLHYIYMHRSFEPTCKVPINRC